MQREIQVERRQRSLFGWVFLVLFWGFNGLMAIALFGGLSQNADTYQSLTNDAERAGHAIGTTLGAGMVLSIWLFGALIIGLMVIMTRGRKIIERTIET